MHRIRAISIFCLLVLTATGCIRHVEYSVKNRGIEGAAWVGGHYSGDVKILGLSEATYPAEGWRIRSDRVRITLPSYPTGNGFLSVVSGGENSPGWITIRLELERYHQPDSVDENFIYNERLHIACAGWTVHVEDRAYPVDRASCPDELVLGSRMNEIVNLQFKVADAVAKEITVHSPVWRLTAKTFKNSFNADPPQVVAPPDVIFERRKVSSSLDFAIR